MKRGFVGVSLPPNTPLPQNETFHVDTFAGGYDARDAQEDLSAGSSPSMLDMEVTRDDRLVRAPGVTQSDIASAQQLILHAGFKYASELVLLAPPLIGVKTTAGITWADAGLHAGPLYGAGNFAGVLLFSNGVRDLFYREPRKSTKIIAGAPPAFGITTFAGRVVLGGTLVSGNMDYMGLGWSDATSDYKGWDLGNGAGAQSMIGSMRNADRFQAFAPLGFDTLAVVNRRSIWIGNPTGDVFQPITFAPRLENTGAFAARTVIPTEYGVIFLADDGVRLFSGNEAQIISPQINPDLLPLIEGGNYSASFDPGRKRYYLHTPSVTWVLDLTQRRWYKWSGIFTDSVFFPTQVPPGPTWGQMNAQWGTQAQSWWQYFFTEGAGRVCFLGASKLGFEDPASFEVFGTRLTPQWFDRRLVGDNQDMLMTHLQTRFTYEADTDAGIEIWLPDKPSGNPELVRSVSIPSGTATRRIAAPLIHTGRGVSLGIKIVSGSPRIRKAAVEYQTTGMLFDDSDLIAAILNPGTDPGTNPTPEDLMNFATVLLPLDNGLDPLINGQWITAIVTFPYELVGYRLIEDCGLSGSLILRVSYATAANFPTFTDISGTTRPTLAASRVSQSTTLSDWTIAGAEYSQLRATVIGDATNITRAILALALRKL
jgi:hypothetical protein